MALPAGLRKRVQDQRVQDQQIHQQSRSRKPVELLTRFMPFLKQWKEQPDLFYSYVYGRSFHLEPTTFGGVYSLLSQSETRIAEYRHGNRLLYVLFALLKKIFGRVRLKGSILKEFASCIRESGLTDEASEDIQKNLGKWASHGERYALLAAQLGGPGSLLLLPKDIDNLV